MAFPTDELPRDGDGADAPGVGVVEVGVDD